MFKRFFLSVLFAVTALTAAATDKTTLYAAVASKGIYAFDPQNLSAAPTLVMSDADYGYMNENAICAFGDGVLYMYQYTERNYEINRLRFIRYRMDGEGKWSLDLDKDVISLAANYTLFPHMFCYDPYSKKLYGFRRDSKTLYEINPETGAMTSLATGCSLAYNCIVASGSGNLYMMSETQTHDVAYLFLKDKQSITHTMIAGYPNLLSDDVVLGSFANDKEDSNLYILNRNQKTFSETEEGVNNSTTAFNANNIYTIDMKNLTYNKDARKIGAVMGGQKIVGFFTVTSEVSAEELTPGECTDLTVGFTTPGQTQATISAKAPSVLFDGKTQATEAMTVKFYAGETLIGKQEGVAPGATASITYDFKQEGAYTVRAVAENKNGEGPEAICPTFAGYDTPTAPTEVTLNINAEGHYTLTWQAPTSGANGGVINQSALTYVVTRFPGGSQQTTSACRAEGEIGSKNYSDYYFTVAAQYKDRISEPATSNHAAYGEAIELPYIEDFSDEATWGRHTICNINGDATWERGLSMLDGISASYNGSQCPNQADDWLITPPMKMHAGTTYTIKFQAFNNQFLTSLPTPLKLLVATSAHPEAYLDNPENHMEQVASLGTLPDWNNPLTAEYEFYNKEEGIKFLAFHLTANPNTRVWIQQYSIIPGASMAAPADVTGLKVTPDAKGALKAVISFTAPTTTMEDKALSEIDYISIYRDGDLNEIHRFEKPAPGAALSYTDEAADLTNDEHEYKVKCFNADGNSEGLARTVLVGQDYAKAPKHLRVSDMGDHYLMTWERPTESVYGGYVDYETTKFMIMIGNAEGEGNPITLEQAYDGTSYKISKSNLYQYGFRDDQMLINFWSISVTPRGYHINGSVAYTSAIYGNAWDLPFSEDVAVDDYGPFTRTYPWTIATYDPYASAGKDPWYLVRADSEKLPVRTNDHDGSGGMFMWYQTAMPEMESYFLSPQLTMGSAEAPTLTFWIWHNNGVSSAAANWVKVYTCSVTDEYEPLCEPILIADGGQNGWRQHTISLAGAKSKVFRLAFQGHAQSGTCFFIDDIVVDNAEGVAPLVSEVGTAGPAYDLTGRSYVRQPKSKGISIMNHSKVLR